MIFLRKEIIYTHTTHEYDYWYEFSVYAPIVDGLIGVGEHISEDEDIFIEILWGM